MTKAAAQLIFDFPAEPRFDPEDFLVSVSNEAAYAAIDGWPDWPDRVLVVTGPAGAGKSHLAAVFAAKAHAWVVPADEVREATVPHLSSSGALAIEDADRGLLDEAAWFHLLNRVRAQGAPLLVTARTPPDAWGLATPDLKSRLRLAPHVSVDMPDDALLRAIVVKLFLDRQLVVDTRVVSTLVDRCERSIPALTQVIDALDRAALAGKRRLTPAFVSAFLGREKPPGSPA